MASKKKEIENFPMKLLCYSETMHEIVRISWCYKKSVVSLTIFFPCFLGVCRPRLSVYFVLCLSFIQINVVHSLYCRLSPLMRVELLTDFRAIFWFRPIILLWSSHFFLSLILLLFSVFIISLYILTPPKQQTNPNGLIFRYA